MKKILILTLMLSLILSVFASCKAGGSESPDGENNLPSDTAPGADDEAADGEEPGDTEKPSDTEKPNDDNKPSDSEDDEEPTGSPFVGNDDLTELCVLSSPSGKVTAESTDDAVTVTLEDTTDARQVVRVPVDPSWETVKITEGETVKYVKSYLKCGVRLVDFYMTPGGDGATVTPEIKTNDKKLESEFGMTLQNGTKIDTNYYPGFVRKSVTFTIDDGDISNDEKFLEIVRPAGILGTFNICRTTDTSSANYLALYDGYEVANHHRLHALPFRETADFHTGKSFESILKNETYHSGADTNYAYKTSIEGLYYINYHYYAESYVGKTSWHAMASDETYFEYAEITKNDIESLFGEGSVVGFAYPHGKLTETVKQYLIDAGYLYARRTGNLKNSTGFSLPEDRFEWTYNADVSCLLDVMAQYEAFADDGELKFFAFGVHAADFSGKWDVLDEFAELYGNRPEDFWYASNRDIFEYEDAVKALEISEEKIVNSSDIAVFITVNDEKVIVPANSVYYLNGDTKIEVTFDADNGTAEKIIEASRGAFISKPSNPTKNGFIFDGWYVDGKKWDFNARATENMVLVARYKANTFEGSTAEVLPVKGGAGGIVAIIHDDGRADTGFILDDLYYEYGLVGDVAMPTYTIYNETTGQTKGDYDRWVKIINTGRWRVISHSATHSWWGNVTKDSNGNNVAWEQDNEKMKRETAGSQEILRNLFPGQRVLTFVYPGFGSESKGLTKEETFEILFSEEARELISEYYVSARYAGENAPAYVDRDSDWMFLDGFFLFPSNINGTGTNSLKNRLESAANDGRIQLISLHAVSRDIEEGKMDSGNYTLSAVDMEKACRMIAEYVDSGKIWNAHYDDAILYVREAQSATVSVSGDANELSVTLTDTMDDEIYNFPLTVRVTVPGEWEAVKITQGDAVSYATAKYLDGKWLIDADIVPDGGVATLVPISIADIPQIPENEPAPPASSIVPETPVTPPSSLLDIEVSIGFETDPGATVDEMNTIEFVDRDGGKALRILDTETKEGGNIIVPFGKTANPEAFSFTFDVNVASANSGIMTMIYFADYTKTPYMLTLYTSESGYYFGDCQSAIGLGTQNHYLSGETLLEFNKWYTIGVDVVFSSVEDFKATIYLNGEKTGESTNRANSASGKPLDAPLQNTVKCLKFSTFNAALLDMQIDNLVMKAGDASVLGLDGSTHLVGNDFEDGISGVTLDRPAICTIETVERADKAGDNVLKIDKHTTGSSATVEIAAQTTVSNAKEFTFEFDINVASAQSGLLTQIFFSSNIAKSPIDFTISATQDGFYFGTLTTYNGGTLCPFGSGNKILSYNKYYHVKLHVVIGDADSFSATLYIDGENAGSSNVFLNPDKKTDYQPATVVNSVTVGCQSGAKCTMYVDNIILTVK